ncbi:MAG TPA: DedA family protein [Gammaproteobacteria bacterium]|jgi:membrane-associated protein|nr:DedA family protein [Gammaproteobacteria bacterium]
METIQQLFQYIIHIDTYLVSFVATYGIWTYVVLFAIIFCETGLVVTPFLPGDSLLFAAGSIAAQQDSDLKIQLLFMLLALASILGNKVNYTIGRFIGPRVFTAKESWLFNKRHLLEAHEFYEKHGGKTIIFARFLPIIRTFVPFVAGIAAMSLRSFTFYNLMSGLLWIGSLLGAGYFFGSLPIIKENFAIVIYSIIGISLLPALFAVVAKKSANS